MKLVLFFLMCFSFLTPAFAEVVLSDVELNCPITNTVISGTVTYDFIIICELEGNVIPDATPPTTGSFNAIKLSLNPPTATRLGGVYAGECAAGEFAYGISTLGTLLCAVP